jgi:hypothetical protein
MGIKYTHLKYPFTRFLIHLFMGIFYIPTKAKTRLDVIAAGNF